MTPENVAVVGLIVAFGLVGLWATSLVNALYEIASALRGIDDRLSRLRDP